MEGRGLRENWEKNREKTEKWISLNIVKKRVPHTAGVRHPIEPDSVSKLPGENAQIDFFSLAYRDTLG